MFQLAGDMNVNIENALKIYKIKGLKVNKWLQ